MEENILIEVAPYLNNVYSKMKSYSDVWNWFNNKTNETENLVELKKNILENTFKISNANLKIDKAVQNAQFALGMEQSVVHLYQSEESNFLNAKTLMIEDEIYLIFEGNIIDILTQGELTALIGHELTHSLLNNQNSKIHQISEHCLSAFASENASTFENTLKNFSLYTEIVCDRGGLIACGNISEMVSMLLKIHTGIKTTNVVAYLNQVKELEQYNSFKTKGVSHPECYIRTKALLEWQKDPNNGESNISKMIEVGQSFSEVDLFLQEKIRDATYYLLDAFKKQACFQNEAAEILSKEYFEAEKNKAYEDTTDLEWWQNLDVSIQKYFSYIFADFLFVDHLEYKNAEAFLLQYSKELYFDAVFKEVISKIDI